MQNAKFDCTKTQDFIHEFNRMCNSYTNLSNTPCVNCPVREECNDSDQFKLSEITKVQQWSDAHPCMPTLTHDEFTFLNSFIWPDNKYIYRSFPSQDQSIGLYVEFRAEDSTKDPTVISTPYKVKIDFDMFSFIEFGECISFEDLLELEVIE